MLRHLGPFFFQLLQVQHIHTLNFKSAMKLRAIYPLGTTNYENKSHLYGNLCHSDVERTNSGCKHHC